MLQNIGVWGDSVLQGVVLDEEQGKYAILKENCVASLTRRTGIPVANNARFGCTAPKGMRFLRRALDAQKPLSAALIEFGGNDCDFDWAEVAARPEGDHRPQTPLEDFTACYADMIGELRRRDITPVLMSLPPLDAQRYFAWVTRGGISRENVLRWLGDVHHIYRWHERYSNAVCRLARQYNVLLVDVREAFLSERNCGRLLCADGIHPNREGHAVMERTLYECAAQFLA